MGREGEIVSEWNLLVIPIISVQKVFAARHWKAG